MGARLPPVFRDYLLKEKKNAKELDEWVTAPWAVPDDKNELNSYARGLWEQWQALERRDGSAKKNYPKETIKAAVVLLTDALVDAAAPVPYELSRLIRAIIKPKSHASTSPVQAGSEKAYWAAIQFEATGRRSLYSVAMHLLANGLFPQGRSQKAVEGTIRGWRKLDHYQANVRLYRPTKAAESLRSP
ncbi:MAG: hypothetical protein WBA44_01040 [Mesorhizobium sp.]